MQPITRKEQFLAAIAGESENIPTPITREEVWLEKIYENGGSGGKNSVTKTEFNTKMKTKQDVITDTGRPVKATVIFSFDQAAIDARVTVLEEYGFRGVFSESGSVSNELMRELADRGFDYSIYGGTGTRPGLDGSVDAWYEYIAGSVDKLTSVGLRYPTLYSCPSHTASLNMIEACKKLGFKYVRCASISNNTTTVNSGWIYPRNNTFNPFKIAICPTNINKGWDIVKSALDEAIENNYMVMLFAHKPNYDGYTEEYYRQVVEYVHTKVSEGVLDCLTPREYYDRYRHENDFKQMSIKVEDMPVEFHANYIFINGITIIDRSPIDYTSHRPPRAGVFAINSTNGDIYRSTGTTEQDWELANISLNKLKDLASASTDFADFKAKIAAL